jgi:hypothetical protein
MNDLIHQRRLTMVYVRNNGNVSYLHIEK